MPSTLIHKAFPSGQSGRRRVHSSASGSREDRGFTAVVPHNCSSLCLQVESYRSSITLDRAADVLLVEDVCRMRAFALSTRYICERLFNRREVPNRQTC